MKNMIVSLLIGMSLQYTAMHIFPQYSKFCIDLENKVLTPS